SFLDVVPDDPLYGQQLQFARISAEAAWDSTQGDSAVIVAIIDTGVDWDHEDLLGNIWQNLGEDADGDGHTIELQGDTVWVLDPGDLNGIDDDGNGYDDDLIGWDFVDAAAADVWPGEDYGPPDNDPSDFEGHGTHTSGIASAVTNNNIGIAGTGWNTTIMPVRIGYVDVDGGGVASTLTLMTGVQYAADNGADIISVSFGSSGASSAFQDIIDYAWGVGAIIVASAGNDGNAAIHFPAGYNHVLAVGSTSRLTDRVSNFSNYGTWVDIFAPGENILSTLPGNTYEFYFGTSMTCPMVAGGVALLKAQFPAESNHEILMRLVGGADNIDEANPSLVGLLGFGRMNIYRALTGTSAIGPNIGARLVFSDTTYGNGDGLLDPGETIQCYAIVENRFLGGVSSDLTLTLSTGDYALSITTSQASVTALQPLTNATTTALVFDIAGTAIAHRAVFTLSITGTDGYAESFDFPAPIGLAPILLVDDDDGGNNVEGYFFDSLDSLGMPFEYWSHMEQGTPTGILDRYSTVIWLCEWTFPSLNSDDRAEVGAYLDGGGKLFLSGQDIGFDMCDPRSPFSYFESGGASKIWYETYLHSTYIEDDASPGVHPVAVTGVAGNPIGDGLAFDVYQPGRSSDQQYPSEIAPRAGAEGLFQYPNGGYGAISWTSGSTKVVNFGFGYEAIMDEGARFTVMDRVLSWLNDFSIDHVPLLDSENSTDPYQLEVLAKSAGAAIDSVAIYWSLDGNVPFNIVPLSMVSTGELGTIYQGSIPAQISGTTVHYFIYAAQDNGFFQTSPPGAPIRDHTFYVGSDLTPPVIADFTEVGNTIDNTGLYPVEADITDNLGVDTSTVYLHFQTNDGVFDSSALIWDSGEMKFSGSISLPTAPSDGDTVRYFISVHDLSAASNRTESAVQEFVIVKALLVDDFEGGLDHWINMGGWDFTIYSHEGGGSSITESPTGFYEDNAEYILENRDTYNLSNRQSASLTFWHTYILESGDIAQVDISTDGTSWQTAKVIFGSVNYTWHRAVVDLGDYTGNEAVRFRYRLTTDGSAKADGWYLDDIMVHVDTTMVVTAVEAQAGLPKEYALLQNYPNPFNPVTAIEYHLPRPGEVRLRLYNLRGQLVRTMVDDFQPAGVHTVALSGDRLASGVYFYRLEAGDFTRTRKMVLLK
ncbi:MAG: S8 family serine peptidase, partial [Candidatus Marinimicrobia bacterium]|nr:S8 family serine peptidase [Candidatus Neomarinimicrobiota bacterium]